MLPARGPPPSRTVKKYITMLFKSVTTSKLNHLIEVTDKVGDFQDYRKIFATPLSFAARNTEHS